jgi:hypothetical protein
MTMVISGSDGVTFPDSTNQFSGGAFSFKNRIINGDMRIDQRNAGAAVTINAQTNTFVVDRFKGIGQPSDGVYTLQQSTTAPTGFVNSVIATVTTADASIGATQFYMFRHPIEGTNIADLGWGTASAKTVTLSFQVRSSLTGTFGGVITNSAQNRSYPFTYSISSANTWEAKSITIAGDTSGTWLTTTGIGLEVIWGLGVGSTYSGTAGSWAGTTYYSATDATNVIGTNGATWYITGVQLEVGSVATPFERRPFGTELALCQRYFEKSMPIGTRPTQANTAGLPVFTAFSTSAAAGWVPHKVTMRAAPTVTVFAPTGTSGAVEVFTSGAAASGTVTVPEPSESGFRYINNGSAGFTSGVGYQFGYTASAEL